MKTALVAVVLAAVVLPGCGKQATEQLRKSAQKPTPKVVSPQQETAAIEDPEPNSDPDQLADAAPQSSEQPMQLPAVESLANDVESIAQPEIDPTQTEVASTETGDDVDANEDEPPQLESPPVRLYLPTESGPLIVDLDIQLDGVPLEQAFKNRIDQTIADANSDDSDPTTWSELLDHVASEPDVFGRNVASGNQRGTIQMMDRNRNKTADYDEVVQFLFRNSRMSVPFRLQGTDYYRDNANTSSTFTAIDLDKSGQLDANEIEHAEKSLLRFDSNADQRLQLTELVQTATNANDDPAWKRQRISRDASVATDLSGYVDWSMAAYEMDALNGKRPFAISSNTFAELDANSSGSISTSETKRLREVSPDLMLTVKLSASFADSPSVDVLWSRESIRPHTQIVSQSRLVVADSELRFCVHVMDRRTTNEFPAEAFAMLDANNDGGLDEAEIPDQFEEQYSFEDYDADDDGKLTLLEIRQGMAPKAPIWSYQVRGRGAEFPDSTFAFLDADGDLTLSTREIATAASRLREHANDKPLSPQSVKSSFLVQLVRGDPTRRAELFAFDSLPSETEDQSTRPNWVTSMDFNGDGEISRLEFVGRHEQFQQLDQNQDGFVQRSEWMLQK